VLRPIVNQQVGQCSRRSSSAWPRPRQPTPT